MSWHVGCSFSRRVTCLLALNGKMEIENVLEERSGAVPVPALLSAHLYPGCCPLLPVANPAAAQTLIMHLEEADFYTRNTVRCWIPIAFCISVVDNPFFSRGSCTL